MCIITSNMTEVTGKVSQNFGGEKKKTPFRHSKLLFVAIAVFGLPFSHASFYRSPPPLMDHSMRVRSAVEVTEGALSDRDGCLRRAMCVMGTIPEDEMPRMSIGYGAENFLHILHRMVTVAGMTGFNKQDLPNMRQIIASNAVGKSAGDLSLCESLFPCRVAVEEFARGAVAVRTENVPLRPNRGLFDHLFAPAIAVQRRHAAQARTIKDAQAVTSCSVSGSMCPGIIIGCSLCGMFSPGTCGDTCIVAGIYCGATGYACQFEPKPAEAQAAAAADEESNDSEEMVDSAADEATEAEEPADEEMVDSADEPAGAEDEERRVVFEESLPTKNRPKRQN